MVVLLAVSAAVTTAFEPLVIKRLFDSFVGGSSLRATFGPFAVLAGMVAVAEVCALGLERMVFRVRVKVSASLLQAAVERLHALPLSYHRDHEVGATISKIERGLASCMAAFADVVVQLVPSLVYLCVSITIMLKLDVRLSLAVIALAPLSAIVGALAAKEQVSREQGQLQRWTRVFARFNEVLSGITMIKCFAMEEREKRRLLNAVDEANGVALKGVATDTRNNATKNVLIAAARLSALMFGGALVMSRSITLGTLMAFIAYVAGVLAPVQKLTGMYQTVRRASVSLDSLLSILHAHYAQTDDASAHEAGPLKGEVAFHNVSFEYRPGIPVLRDVDLHVQPGETVALVGPGGTGKSTLMALLQRLYDPASGTIEVDGQDLRSIKPTSLRNQIGVVLQEPVLLNDSIRDNIAFGRPTASDAEIEAAASAADAHDFVSALPDGYDTLVGERGCKLSSGERQRIAIARALLKDAPILVLDEPTSGLDAEGEHKLKHAIDRLARGKTTFVIAHTPAALATADRILVLKDGTIAEAGAHPELMRSNGYYASVVRKQAEMQPAAV